MPFDVNIFDSNFNFEFKVKVANNIRIATKAFDEFWKNNALFLNEAEELYGRILSYSVNRQFKKAASSTASAFLVSGREVNSYRTKAVFLDTPDYITSICRTNSSHKLPCKAAYKSELALGNKEDNVQMELFQDEGCETVVAIPKKYAILGYRYVNGKMEHMNIVVPDWEYKNIIHSENLLNNLSEYYNYVPEELVEETVASLKNDITKEAQKQNII